MIKKFQGFILYVLITVFVAAIYLDGHTLLEKWDLKISDQMFRLRGKETAGQEIVLLQIDPRATDLLGRFPWSRERWAGVLNALSLYRPKVVALDLNQPFVDKADTSARGMYLLAEVLERGKNIVVPFAFVPSEVSTASSTAPAYFTSAAFPMSEIDPKSKKVVSAGLVNYPDRWFAEKAAGLGHNSQIPDLDGSLRWHPLAVNVEGQVYPSLVLTAARLYLGLGRNQSAFLPGEGVRLGGDVIPTDNRGRLFVNYVGPAETFKSYNLSDVLLGQIDPNGLSKKIVILGRMPTGISGFYTTPVEPQLPQTELTANLVENIIHKRFLKALSLSKFLDLSFLILIGVLAAFVLPQLSLTYRFVVLGIFLVALLNLAFILFNSFGILTKPFYPLLELLFFIGASPVLKARRTAEEFRESYESGYDRLEGAYEKAAAPSVSRAQIGEERSEAAGSPQAYGATESFQRTEAMPEPEIIAGELTLYEATSLAPKIAAATPQPAKDLPQTLGRYQILEVLGKGAMGTVYKGSDPAIDRLEALKTIRLDTVADEGEIQELKERLVREAKAAGKLSHPNIVTIYDVGHEGDLQYIAMEYLEGYTLEEIIKRKVDLNYRIVAKLIVQVCDALDYAHDRGIVHRDIKPANIMVMNNFQVKVMDFGIARLETSASMTQTGIAMGTPNYISPEQLQGKSVDRRSDIFALGVVLYEFLTREKPFRGENLSQLIYNIINHNPPLVVEKNENIPMIFNRATMRAIAKDPLQRYQRAGELSIDLKDFLAAFQGLAKPAPKPQPQA